MSILNRMKRKIKHNRINRNQRQLRKFSKYRLNQEIILHRISFIAITAILFLIFLVGGLITL